MYVEKVNTMHVRYLISTGTIRLVRRGYEEVRKTTFSLRKICKRKITHTKKGHEALDALELLSDKELAIATIGHDRWKT